jgi:Uri superfamily endonuclease
MRTQNDDEQKSLFATEGPFLNNFPASAGAYALLFRAGQPFAVAPGKLGVYRLPAGVYAYLGSALGTGGIRARIRYHLSDRPRSHWHVDVLTRTIGAEAVCWATGTERLECTWLQLLVRLAGSRIPIPRFGSTDCTMGCPVHLVEIAANQGVDQLAQVLRERLPTSQSLGFLVVRQAGAGGSLHCD